MTRFGDLWLDNVWPVVIALGSTLPEIVDGNGVKPITLLIISVTGWVVWQLAAKPNAYFALQPKEPHQEK